MTTWVQFVGPLYPDVGAACVFYAHSSDLKSAVFGELVTSDCVKEFTTGHLYPKEAFGYWTPIQDTGIDNIVYYDEGDENGEGDEHSKEVSSIQ